MNFEIRKITGLTNEHLFWGAVCASSFSLRKFIESYNKEWLICRLGYKSPIEAMEQYEREAA